MIVNQIFAEISEGTVQNIMVCDNYEMANYISRCTYGENAFAVDSTQYGCSIGDKFHDNRFWRVNEDGTETEIPYTPTVEEEAAILKQKNETLETELTSTQLALTEQYEENLALQEEVTNTQLALCEIYEGGGAV